MNLVKAIVAGLVGGLIMFIVLMLGTNQGIAPFNIPPSAAFLVSLGIPPKPLAPILHFAYAALGSVVLVLLFGRQTNVVKGIGLALILWLIFMLVYSPIIGWGIFGAAGPTTDLSKDAALYLGSSGKFVLITLILHVIYGIVIGWLDRHWIDWSSSSMEGDQ
ncbi:MAG: DUF6789 family protein [Halothece sp.]